jgi:hypothetical protein
MKTRRQSGGMIATLRRYIDRETLGNVALFVIAMIWVFAS